MGAHSWAEVGFSHFSRPVFVNYPHKGHCAMYFHPGVAEFAWAVAGADDFHSLQAKGCLVIPLCRKIVEF